MNTTEQHLKRIQDKLQQLLKQYVALQKENQLLENQVKELKTQQAQYDTTIETLKQQVDILRFSNGEMEEEDKKQFEKRINAYVKEIDRCISLLSK